LEASVDGLNIKPNGVYVDATFGGGGHSREILKRLKDGKLIAFDQDEDVMNNIPDDDRLIFVRHNFRFLKNFLRYHGFKQINGLLADLGVSSHHFDTPRRGFSFRFNSELDMRMNTKSGLSAKEVINSYPEQELFKVFRTYGELKNAGRLVKSILASRSNKSLSGIQDLKEAITDCLPKHNANQYLAKVFQALRIEVNKEIDNLKELLLQATELLVPGGRVSIISYHSLEDRLVKNYYRSGSFDNIMEKDMYGNVLRPLQPVNRKVIIPNQEEIENNSRARSARLRIAEKDESL
jgi:16S rRNA (cytosine1402-N4)-methyltransferase